MLASAVIPAAELLAVLLVVGAVTLAAGLCWLRRRVRRLKLPGRAAAARRAGSPTGDLDSLCRRLREAAQDTSRCLPLSPEAPAETRDLVQAAGQVRDAAASAAAATARPATRLLAEDTHRETQALVAGIAAAGLTGDHL